MKPAIVLRLTALASLLAMAPIIATAPAEAAGKRFENITIRVGTYGGAWRNLIMANVGKAFEAEGGKLEILAGQPADSMAKLIAARGAEPPFELMETVDNFIPDLIRGGFLEEIRLDHIPNRLKLGKDGVDKFRLHTWTEESGIIYNTEKFKEHGIPVPTKYADLTNPKLSGLVSVPDIGGGGVIPCLVGFSIEGGGSESNIDHGLALINKMNVKAFWKSSSQLQTLFQSGDVWAACAGVHNVARLKGSLPVWAAFIALPNGKTGLLKQGWITRIKGGKHLEAQEFVINAYLGFENQLAISKGGLLPSNLDALKQMAADKDLGYMRLTPELIGDMYSVDYNKVDQNKYVQQWNRTIGK